MAQSDDSTTKKQPAVQQDALLINATQEFEQAEHLDPQLLGMAIYQGLTKMRLAKPLDAETYFRKALQESPDETRIAEFLGMCILQQGRPKGSTQQPLAELTRKYPTSGRLALMNAIWLANNESHREAARELQRAEMLGTKPTELLSPAEAQGLKDQLGHWALVDQLLYGLAWFGGIYGCAMLLMAVCGLILGSMTRDASAANLLGDAAQEIVSHGQVVRTSSETLLSRLYAGGLFAGLILFYIAVPFVIVGLLAGTAALLYFIFQAGRIPVKLVILIGAAGLCMAWATFKSVFASMGSGSFGLPKSQIDHPQLQKVIDDVARQVDTKPVNVLYLAPGSSISVHQEGRGPFGMFGVKNRVLTLGLSTLSFLNVSELRSILAHEYAHFSHRDTFFSRFIYQVELSIGLTLQGMNIGWLTYFNPFYWFMFLYYKCYSLLSSGYSRSREFLADRMAASLYGSDVFENALRKVYTDGSLFESTIYHNIDSLLNEGKMFVNMYEGFRSFRDEQMSAEEREQAYQSFLTEKSLLWASHPTYGERIAAVRAFPANRTPDTTPAMQLLEQPEEMEKELTEFLTQQIAVMRQLQAQAAEG